MQRIIQKRIEIVTSSLKGFESLTSQNILNLILYLIKNVISLSKTNIIKIRTKDLREFLSHNLSDQDIETLFRELIKSYLETNLLRTVKNEQECLHDTKYAAIELQSIIKKIKCNRENKYLEIHLDEAFIEYADTKSEYVTVLLSKTQKAKSKYTPKLLEFISYYTNFHTDKTNNAIKLSLQGIKDVLSISEDKYKDFKVFNHKVLKKVQKECAELGLRYSYTPMKAYKDGAKRKSTVGIEIRMTNKDKKLFADELKEYKYKNLQDDQLLQFVAEQAKKDTIEHLKSILFKSDEFAEVIKTIEAADSYTMYKLIYKKRFPGGVNKYKLVSYYDLDDIIEYFTTGNNKRKKFLSRTRFIQNLLNQVF